MANRYNLGFETAFSKPLSPTLEKGNRSFAGRRVLNLSPLERPLRNAIFDARKEAEKGLKERLSAAPRR